MLACSSPWLVLRLPGQCGIRRTAKWSCPAAKLQATLESAIVICTDKGRRRSNGRPWLCGVRHTVKGVACPAAAWSVRDQAHCQAVLSCSNVAGPTVDLGCAGSGTQPRVSLVLRLPGMCGIRHTSRWVRLIGSLAR